ncbi:MULTISPECIES: SHOCT domain-containing protein [unclassified Arthrobacter]|uniref:SHOCT domain-containing protein n=1 Tax=Micrococcaceae TaxID=1268 RepID=UPI003265EC28
MNQHAVPTEPGQYIFAFSLSRGWLRIAGTCAVAAVVMAVVANATEPFRAPLGIALGVLAITLLIALAIKGSSRRQAQEPAAARARTGGHRRLFGKMRGRRSLAAELALLAELHAKGALSDEEFSAAKLRTLAD